MQFYHYNTFDIHHKVQVDNLISIFVYDNQRWQCMLHGNANPVLDYFHYINMIGAL